MSELSDERLELLAQAASLYFEDGLNQGEIAEQLGISRARVSRLVAEARELGVVEIRVNSPHHTGEFAWNRRPATPGLAVPPRRPSPAPGRDGRRWARDSG